MKFWICLALCLAAPVLAAESTPQSAPKDEMTELEFALYFAPKPAADPAEALQKLLAEPDRRLASEKSTSRDNIAFVTGHWIPLKEYAPPDATELRYLGVGMPPTAAADLAAAERAYVVMIHTHPARLPAANRAANQLMADLARETNGRIWDQETRQVFSLEAWIARRVKSWEAGDLPDMRTQVAMRAISGGKGVRILTLGMRKFALPDLVFPEVTSANSLDFANLLNVLRQRLAEGQAPKDAR